VNVRSTADPARYVQPASVNHQSQFPAKLMTPEFAHRRDCPIAFCFVIVNASRKRSGSPFQYGRCGTSRGIKADG